MDLQLTGKVALVTGGSKGIGAAIVRAFAAEGATAAIVNRPGPDGPALAQEIVDGGGRARFFEAELTREADCERVVRQAVEELGRIDILVNNAGINDGVGLDGTPGAFMDSLRRNVMHFFALAHFAAPWLKAGRGSIVNIGSKVSVTGQGRASGYGAAKGAVNALTREWAVALAPFGVRVNAVVPAEVWTPQYAAWIESLREPGAMLEKIGSMVPLERRLTRPGEIADTVLFLASPRSSHTTGQVVFVDGGYTHLDRACTDMWRDMGVAETP